MVKIFFVIAFLFATQFVHAQYVKLDNGIVFSSFNNKKDLEILSSDRISSYSILLGADYLEKKWFYLSSQIGYLKIGGNETNALLEGEFNRISENKNFIHLNTTLRIYKKLDDIKLFVGIGPYINILADTKKFESKLYNSDYSYNSHNIGGQSELGVTFDIKQIRIGLMGKYLLGVTPSAKSEALSLYNNSIAAMLTIGYKIN